MAKGKKKGGKKTEEKEKDIAESVGSLSLGDSGPSTSQQATAQAPALPPVPAPAAAKPADDEEESGGLGLGGTKKRPKKKKQAAKTTEAVKPTGQEQSNQAQASQGPQQSGPPIQAPQQSGHPGQIPIQGGPPSQVPGQTQQQPYQAGQGPQQSGPPTTPWQGGQPVQGSQPGGPPGPAPRGRGQTQGGPRSQAPGQPQQQPYQANQGPQQRGPPPAPWQGGQPVQGPQPGGPPGPAPRGRGQAQGGPRSQGPGQPQQQPYQPGQGPQQRGPPPAQWQGGQPVQGPQPGGHPGGDQRGPSQAPTASQQRGPPPQQKATSQVQPYARFAIPARINGKKVPTRAVKLLTNYLAMKISSQLIHRYDVGFVPDKPKKFIARAFEAAMKQSFPGHLPISAFDQMKNMYTMKPLPQVSQHQRFATKVQITDENGRVLNFEVSFKGTGIVDLNTLNKYMASGATSLSPPTEAIQCVDVILRQGTLSSYIKAGRQFFRRPDRPVLLGDGLEMWTGLFQSAIFTSRPYINIDVAHKGFPIHQDFITLLNSFRLDPRSPLDSQRGRGLETLILFLKGLRVVARIGGDKSQNSVRREFIVNELAQPANRQMFMLTDASGKQQQCSVYDYFLSKGCRLQYPNLNCVWVGPRDKSIYYPMEVLEVAYGQVRNRQLNEFQLSTMVREAATPPDVRKRKIEEVIRNMNYSRNPFFRAFGLEISEQFTGINGKILFAPKMQCGPSEVLQPRKGVWNSDKLLQGMPLNTWGIIAVELDPNTANADAIVNMFKNQGRQMGMAVAEPTMRQFNVRIRDLEGVMRTAVQKRLQMMVVVVSGRVKDAYSHVKKMAERTVGLLTQCIKENTAARRMNPQTVRNILLKVNSKLMGTNYAIDGSSLPDCMRKGDIMVVGADVTHPSPEQSNIPSIAAVTASIDKRCFKYNIEFSIQTPKKEMIVEFEDMMFDHLKVYRAEQNSLPNKIYVFRDGVSEGQFAEVMHSELQAVYNAYQRIAGPNKKPEVLFLLVQKRHHTRFFLENSSYNVEPGTCVDSDIVHKSELDFYLVSHQAIKGTARPTRYHAVCNDGALPHDEVEQLAYYLCHLYSRCTRSVSYPTPTYYAHLACLRARTLTLNERFDNNELEKKPKRLYVLPAVQQTSRMFFV